MDTKSSETYLQLRSDLLSRGITLKSFAEKHRLPLSSVYSAASGARVGKRSQAILKKLQKAANDQ